MEYSVIEKDPKTDDILDVLLVTKDENEAKDLAASESIWSNSKFEVKPNTTERREVIKITY